MIVLLIIYIITFQNLKKCRSCRNDKIDGKIILEKYDKIVISPGPGNPNQAGNCLKIVKEFIKNTYSRVCLGHQIISQVLVET